MVEPVWHSDKGILETVRSRPIQAQRQLDDLVPVTFFQPCKGGNDKQFLKNLARQSLRTGYN